MTQAPSRTPGATTGVPVRALITRHGGWLVAVGVLLAAVAALTWTESPLRDVLVQVLYVCLGLTLPGTLVHRALRGPRESWLADLAMGTALGLALELGAWAVYTAIGVQSHLWTWPILTLALLAWPAGRRRILRRPTGPGWGVWPAVAVGAAATLWILMIARGFMSRWALPPSGTTVYPDLVWHMGLASEATRSVPLLTPQSVADGTLRYHWFSDAHIAAASLISGSSVPLLVLRLWILPVAVLTIILTGVLAQRVSGRAWVGGLASWLVVPTLGYPFWPGIVTASYHMNPLSPSQLFATPLILLLVLTLVDLVRSGGRPPAGTVVVAVLAALACSGSKSSALPVVLGGIAAAFVAALVLRRGRVLLLVAGALMTALVVVAMVFVAGGDAGSGLQLFSAWSRLGVYRAVITPRPDLDTLVLDGLVNAPGVGPVLLISLILITVLTYLRLFSGFIPFVQRALRVDLAAWLLAGASLSAFIPFLVIAHRGASQLYFLFGAVPLGAALWAWSIGELVGDSPARARTAAWALGVGAAATVLAGLALRHAAPPAGKAQMLSALGTFSTQVTVATLVVLLVATGALWLWRRGQGAWMPLAACLVIAPLVGSGVLQLVVTPRSSPGSSTQHLLDQDLAAAWISDNVPLDDVMATNDHCLSGEGPSCNSREWWISGLGGRRVLIESWDYLPPSAILGRYHDPALAALNQAAFTDPGPRTFAPLRDRGVSWLVADSTAEGSLSPRLPDESELTFRSGDIAVYRMP